MHVPQHDDRELTCLRYLPDTDGERGTVRERTRELAATARMSAIRTRLSLSDDKDFGGQLSNISRKRPRSYSETKNVLAQND